MKIIWPTWLEINNISGEACSCPRQSRSSSNLWRSASGWSAELDGQTLRGINLQVEINFNRIVDNIYCQVSCQLLAGVSHQSLNLEHKHKVENQDTLPPSLIGQWLVTCLNTNLWLVNSVRHIPINLRVLDN